jgi:hypothetical protein
MSQPPKYALKTIIAGRLKGKTDINPQWRYRVLTEQFGPCGIGWKYTIDEIWNVQAHNEILAFARVSLYVKIGETWSDPIPGIGGSKLVEQESKGPHPNDEGYKMAVTDALSVALKMLGVASDIYMGLWDGSKYRDALPSEPKKTTNSNSNKNEKTFVGTMATVKSLVGKEAYYDCLGVHGYEHASEITDRDIQTVIYTELRDFAKQKQSSSPPAG